MGGGYDYAGAYSKYKPEQDAKFESYVDKYPDLASAWTRIENDPNHPDSQYWIKRGATSKSAFGRAHAAEDFSLKTGNYHGGASGRTDYMPGTDAWKTLFSGDDPSTRFEGWLSGADSNGNGNGNGGNGDTGGWAAATGGGAPGSAMYPMGLVDYTAPDAMTGVSMELQPWLQADHIPDSLWNYQPPTLDEWEIARNWDWASKPASEYAPKPPATTTTTTQQQHAPEGGERNNDAGVPWQDTFLAPLGYKLGWDFAGYNPGQGQDMDGTDADIDAEIAAAAAGHGLVA